MGVEPTLDDMIQIQIVEVFFFSFFFLFFSSRDQLTKQKKKWLQKKNTYIAAVFDHRNIIIL